MPLPDGYSVSCAPEDMQMDRICDMLHRTYWAEKRPDEVIRASIANSLTWGIFHKGRQVALARAVTDKQTFAWICDVFVEPEHRGIGLSKALMGAIMENENIRPLRRVLLATRDAQTLYERYGFAPISTKLAWLERLETYEGESAPPDN